MLLWKNAYHQSGIGNYKYQISRKVIGNDIVDLKLANTEINWRRNGFLNKIFTQQEQNQILTSKIPDLTVWSFWSRKEAAYKIYNRQSGIRKFNPIQYECFDLELERVVFEDSEFYTRTQINSEFVYTEAVLNLSDFDKIKTILKPLKIYKKDGVPNYLDQNLVLKPLSITHHGTFERVITIT